MFQRINKKKRSKEFNERLIAFFEKECAEEGPLTLSDKMFDTLNFVVTFLLTKGLQTNDIHDIVDIYANFYKKEFKNVVG